MSLTVNVPAIAITPEAEEDDDNNFLNLNEALTDVEDLYDETVSSRKHAYKKKLKIKVSENDGYATGMEDVEASDDDDTTIIAQHTSPIAIDNLDMDQYSAEETHGVTKKTLDSYEYLNMQSSKSDDSIRTRDIKSINSESALTDVEEYNTENELEEEKDIPDTDNPLDNEDSIQTVNISDEIQDKSNEVCVQECPTPQSPTNFPTTFLEAINTERPVKRPPTFTQLAKGKMKNDDNKIRRRKRNKTSTCKIIGPKDAEGTESSETELVEPRTRRNFVSMNSLNFESDLEEDNKLPFPVCKKTFTKKKNFLEMPELNTNNITDTEEFECEADISRRRISVDNRMFQKQLDEMASCYSFTKDKDEAKQKKSEREDDKPKRNLKVIKEGDSKVSTKFSENTLMIPTADEGGLTDVENISSSLDSDESEENGGTHSSSATEEENFRDTIPLDNDEMVEINLPPATRLLVISEETKSLVPTVRILPLDETSVSESETELPSTEDESIDSDIQDNRQVGTHSPLLPTCEGGLVNVTEDCVQSSQTKPMVEEILTDTEDLNAENQKRKKDQKLKTDSKYLIPNNILTSDLTDIEDLDISEDKSEVSQLSLPYSEIEGHTDVEDLESLGDIDNNRNPSPKVTFNTQKMIPPDLVLPGNTDTEDVAASTDDEISYSRAETATPHELRKELDQASSIQVNIENLSKIDYSVPEEVMYLKGGGFQEMLTDTEESFEDNEVQVVAVEAWEYFNQDGSTVAFFKPEWGATKEELVDISETQPQTVREETKGTDSPKPSGSHDTSTLKDQSQGSGDRQERQTREPSLDQHQLSEEMKELLKEMEKASKH